MVNLVCQDPKCHISTISTHTIIVQYILIYSKHTVNINLLKTVKMT